MVVLKHMTDQKEIWDLSHLLEGKTTQEILNKVKELVVAFKNHKIDLTNEIKPNKLHEIIQKKEEISKRFSKLSAYLEMKFFENTTNQETLAEMTKINQIATDMSNDMLFFSIWFTKLEDETANKLINSNELSNYKHYLKKLRQEKPFIKDEETEKIINIKNTTGGDAIASIYELMTSEFKYDFLGEKNVSLELVSSKTQSQDPKEREAAYKTILTRYKEHSTVLGEIYKNIVLDWDNEDVKIRGHSKPISSRNMSNDVEDIAVDALLTVVRKKSKIFVEYFKLKHKINKNNGDEYDFSRYHIYAPYNAGPQKKYSYEEAKEIVMEIYKDFDEKFYELAKEIFDKKHVHSHPEPSKRMGAFCYSVTPQDVPYILLNHTGTLRDVFTLIHEFGHGIHGQLARIQTPVNYHAGIAMAETASIFSEMILADKMLMRIENKKEKIALLIRLLDNEFASITRQAYFLYFEEWAHDNIKEGVTKEQIDKKYGELLKEQFGDMKIPEEFKSEWNYIPHIHASPFYVYGYAWGNLLVLSLYQLYKENGEEFKTKYKGILSAGSSKSPKELLGKLGIDPNKEEFWEKGFTIIEEQLEELKKLF